MKLSSAIRGIMRDESGATAIEYGLITALIAVACMTAVQSLGTTITASFDKTTTALAK